ncbi:MAG: 30S ribosomal protein S9 [Candidatus Micrarchaeota archaeon]|nr:30S ribosomal protein S9 [Candidatus Micrarchaeota archaeon]
MVVRSKRKEAVARAYIRKGKGRVRINKLDLNAVGNPYTKAIMSEPLTMIDNSLAKGVDIDIDVYGGGTMGQAQAVRSAIARALVAYTKDAKLRDMFHSRDKFLVVEDSRRVEPKKYKGPKARARFQKSYR